MGIPLADQERPKIAIVNTSSRMSVCFAHLDDIVDVVADAIYEAGGLPLEIRTRPRWTSSPAPAARPAT